MPYLKEDHGLEKFPAEIEQASEYHFTGRMQSKCLGENFLQVSSRGGCFCFSIHSLLANVSPCRSGRAPGRRICSQFVGFAAATLLLTA